MEIRINSVKLTELLEQFNILTGIRIVIFDDEFKEIISYPAAPVEYCALIKKDPEAGIECKKCDMNAFNKCKQTGSLQIYKCHAGLVDVAAPIKENNMILGYVMFGQILDREDKQEAFDGIEHKLKNYKTDIDILKQAFFKLDYRSTRQIKAASSILEACACYLWLSELVSVKNERIINRIEKYINEHLSEQFTVQDISRELSISRSRLYEITKQIFGMGIAQYIMKYRIAQAKKLLSESDRSVCETATLIGIQDYNYFYKVFKKETGFSPSYFKNKNG